jgi:hypothetical protein
MIIKTKKKLNIFFHILNQYFIILLIILKYETLWRDVRAV